MYKFYSIFSEVANYGQFILGNKSDKQKQKSHTFGIELQHPFQKSHFLNSVIRIKEVI